MTVSLLRTGAPLLFLTCLLHVPARAQTPDVAGSRLPGMVELATVGSEADDRRRTAQLLGEAPLDGTLIRSASSLTSLPPGDSAGLRWAPLSPVLGVTWTSQIPFTLGGGPVWTGRGATMQFLGGAQAAWGPVRLVLAPRAVYTQNDAFSLLPEMDQTGTFLPPWRTGRQSLDLPLRPGAVSSTRVTLGESSLSAEAGPVEVGLATESQWWGPGIRNAIVLSDNAPEIPHLFLRTASPLRTRAGTIEAVWILGSMSQSAYFDTLSGNGHRSLSGLAATLRPAWEPRLTLGVARVVYAPVEGTSSLPGHFFDVLTRWPVEDESEDAAADPGEGPGAEQLFSLFGRWVLPDDGLEVYGEWARHSLPQSFRDLLTAPNHTQGYTLGFQWATPLREDGTFRLGAEATNLEQSATSRARPTDAFYASRYIPQGYTHRGRVVGAAIGPGASSQWIAADYLSSSWRVGLTGGRVRWDNDAYYGRTTPWPFLGHDVSVFGGVRGSYTLGGLRLDAELITEKRLNYLFQNRGTSWETSDDAEDVRNHTLRLALTPVGWRRAVLPADLGEIPPAPAPPALRAAPDSAAQDSLTTTPQLADTAGVSVPVALPPASPEPPAPEPVLLQPAPVADSVPAGAMAPRTHLVRTGETLFGIARRYGISITVLRAANPEVVADRIRAGQVLRIPHTAGSPPR